MSNIKRQNAALPNRHIFMVGASGSGKSSFIRQQVDFKQARIVAWDPEEDFKLPRVTSMAAFEKLVKKSGFGPIRVALTINPTEENFERFCALVFAICHQAAPIDVLVDELADVARIGKASPHWGQLPRKARKYNARLVVATQRPQEVDKTIINQAKFKWCGAMSSLKAWKYMADEMEIPLTEFKQLENIEKVQVQYWLKDGTRPAVKDTMRFKK